MKRVAWVLAGCMLMMLVGCAQKLDTQIVKSGAALCREDFYIYEDGEIIADPDATYDGHVTQVLTGETARGINASSSLKEIKKAYKGTNFGLEEDNEYYTAYTCSDGNYILELYYTKHDEGTFMQSISVYTVEYKDKKEKENAENVEKRLRELVEDDMYEYMEGLTN